MGLQQHLRPCISRKLQVMLVLVQGSHLSGNLVPGTGPVLIQGLGGCLLGKVFAAQVRRLEFRALAPMQTSRHLILVLGNGGWGAGAAIQWPACLANCELQIH